MSNLERSDKKELSVPIPAIKISEPKAKDIDIAIIGANIYCIAQCFKRAQIFALLIKNIQYQAKKEARAEINPKSVVLQKYYNFHNVFSKKDLDTLLPYLKYVRFI